MILPLLPIPHHPSQEVLDSTKLQGYQDCPRRFFYEYLLGWRNARPNNHLHFGKAVHLAFEHIIREGYTGDSVIKALEIFNTEYRGAFPPETDPIFTPKTPDRFFDLLIEYLKKYADDPLRYEVYKTEFGGTISLSPTHELAFKMDTILFDRETQLYTSLEHKTKGSNYISDNYPIEHEMGIQCGTYTHVLNCLFPPEEVGGVIINCLCFKKTKKPEFILQRFPIMLSNNQMNIWLENTIAWMDRIYLDLIRLSETKESADVMTAFPCNGRNCTNYNSTCPYILMCRNWANPLQHLHQMPVDCVVDLWNPLLEEGLREILTL